MAQERDSTERRVGDLHQFEKNRYFQGKLMTARDMQIEQEYHAERLHAMNRFATGSGILRGVTVSAVEETDSDLEVTLEPGIVLDGYGRPIVVEHTTTKPLPLPSRDELYLFLHYDESDLESVPVPNIRGAIDEENASNRTVESFALTYEESPPESLEPVPDVDTSLAGARVGEVLRAIADRYHERHRTTPERRDDPAIFIGAFERTDDGSWTEAEDSAQRELAYDNEMLYAILVNHITDTRNPHDVSAQPVPAEGEQPQDVEQQLRAMNSQLETLRRYVMRKSIMERIRFFKDVSERFASLDTSGSRTAREIVDEARAGMENEVYDDPDEYRSHVRGTLTLDLELGEELKESATSTEDSLQRYRRAVDELQEILRTEGDVLRVAEAQDQVCEAAESLEVSHPI